MSKLKESAKAFRDSMPEIDWEDKLAKGAIPLVDMRDNVLAYVDKAYYEDKDE